MIEGEAETVRVGGMTMHVAELGERKVDFAGGNGVASVSEHFQSGSARQVVSVTFNAAIIDELTQTPFHLFCFFLFFSFSSHSRQFEPVLSCHLSLTVNHSHFCSNFSFYFTADCEH